MEASTLLTKQKQKMPVGLESLRDVCKSIFCNLIRGRILAGRERVGMPIALCVVAAEQAAVRGLARPARHVGVLGRDGKFFSNHHRVNARMPDA
jgi:hypothetical protein